MRSERGRKRRLAAIGVAVVAVLAVVGVLLRWWAEPDPADADWSALAPVDPDIVEVAEPSAEAVRVLDRIDPCAAARAGDRTAEVIRRSRVTCTVAGRGGEVTADVAPLAGDVATAAFEGTDTDLAGYLGLARVSPAAGTCLVLLPAGTRRGLLLTSEDAPGCAGLVDRARDLVSTLEDDPGALERPVLSSPPPATLPFTRFGEPSVAGVGACRDLWRQFQRDCAEHTAGDVPDDPVELLRAGEADPDVLCTVALETAEEVLDEPVAAVTASTARPDDRRLCVLLVGDREWVVEVEASREPAGSGSADGEVGGHPYLNPILETVYDVALGETDERGTLRISFSRSPHAPAEPDWGGALLEDLVERTLG